ncbi:hypothetical protein L1987_13461 [Smallanthus sonchifolius]|uniref:Uncharacterized protein n=1 Tax=Smallanthus sonchifolius TaxID=185202 RepID=A0ACB9JJ98_9ASTR|nr:hypothetical protein L1987_13461 [Smallanthus sonchifolius]
MLDNQVDAERSYHRHVLSVLEELHAELILAMHAQESSQPATEQSIFVPTGDATQHVHNQNQDYDYFFRKVIHPFDTQADGI